MDDVILLALKDPPAVPVERVLPAPYERPDIETFQTKLLFHFAPQPHLDRFAGFEAAAGCDPEPVATFRRTNAHQQHLVLGRQHDCTNRFAFDDHDLCVSGGVGVA